MITNYRGGRHTQRPNQLIVAPKGCEKRKDATQLLGKKVVWTSPAGKRIVGKVTRLHGTKGCVVVRFKKGLPGQALGTEVEILDAAEEG